MPFATPVGVLSEHTAQTLSPPADDLLSSGVQMIAPLKHDPKKPSPDLIRGGYGFFGKIMLEHGAAAG
jgi:hypothetical protein